MRGAPRGYSRLSVESPGLFTRLLSLGSARDGARSSLEDLAGRSLALVEYQGAQRPRPFDSVVPERRRGTQGPRGSDLAIVELPTLLLRLLLDFARRPRGGAGLARL